MKYQAYHEYKDSGVEWLGEVPKEWGLIPLKRIVELNPKKSELCAEILEKACSFIPMEKLKTDSLILDEKRTIRDVYEGYTYFRDGDVLMAKVTPCFENKNIAIATKMINGIGFGSSEIYVLRVNYLNSNRFIFYRLQENNFMVIATSAMTGAGGLKRVPADVIGSFNIAIPNKTQQETIANFLDHETAKIDTLIEKQQRLIALLKEKRQAVISHAVTKGLNPNASMRDSEVEWLGEVPEHWEVTRLKYHIRLFEQGWSPQCDTKPAEKNEYGVLKVGCVNHGIFNSAENKALPRELVPQLQYLLSENDLLISRANTKELVGSAAVVDDNFANLILCDKLYRLRFDELIIPQLVAYYLALPVVRQQIELAATGASHSMQNIGQSTIKEMPLIIPPLQEACDLILAIKRKVNVFEIMLTKVNEQINLLQERRTALISAAVTGKIDVRGWQAPQSAGIVESNKTGEA